MKTTRSRKEQWPRKITVGRVFVTIYKRTMPNGEPGFLVANYASGKRRLDSFAAEADAIEAAGRLARQLSEHDTIAATLTKTQAVEYVRASEVLKPFNVSVGAASEALSAWLKKVGDLAALHEAVKFYAARHKIFIQKRVADVLAEFLAIKESRGASVRYMEDLRSRLNRFAGAFQKDMGNVTTADVQAWLDSQKFSPQNHMGFYRVIHLFFKFAVARGYAVDNPAAALERVKVKHGATQIFTPKEIAKLLASVTPDFLPCIALGAFAGLRSAEIERLEWSDIDLDGRHIIIGADKAKTASRRVVPIHGNLAAWLAPYAGQQGLVWKAGHEKFYEAQTETANAAGLKWKQNALRHSYASYRFSITGDAGRVAGECGNSASVVHKHYRELVKPADALQFFGVLPEGKAAPATMKVPVVTARRHARASITRMPEVGTVAAN